jgi:hypothetical protein
MFVLHVRKIQLLQYILNVQLVKQIKFANLIILGKRRSTQRNKVKYKSKGTNNNGEKIKLRDHIDFCWVCGIQHLKNVLLMGVKDPLLVN